VTPGTVKTHLANSYATLAVPDKAAAVPRHFVTA
jgi:DNA-binding CsgD family transcriptional regulator